MVSRLLAHPSGARQEASLHDEWMFAETITANEQESTPGSQKGCLAGLYDERVLNTVSAPRPWRTCHHGLRSDSQMQ